LLDRPAPLTRAALPVITVERFPVSLPTASSTRPAILSMAPLIVSCRADRIPGVLS
jgi:hypothetical protein